MPPCRCARVTPRRSRDARGVAAEEAGAVSVATSPKLEPPASPRSRRCAGRPRAPRSPSRARPRCAPRARTGGRAARTARGPGSRSRSRRRGRPAQASGTVARASATASAAVRATTSRARSEVRAVADDRPPRPPQNTRTESPRRATASRSRSRSPRTPRLERRRPSSSAPPPGTRRPRARVQARTRPARGGESTLALGPADGDAVDAQRGQADADRHALPVLAAGADARVERAGRCRSRVTRCSTSGPLPIRVAPFTGAPILPSSMQVRLARREHELAARDVDLPAAERHRVQAALHRAQDLARDRPGPRA